ncbi:DUF72 domain-containing protein [Polycladospora coralii]|uniref:DUF72 domain-containing protein n=1 Tax=Polycladospora coralii TaxID=2771432 RepID=UPI001CD0EE84|nr:DUF72 domain-containing protein [Polycladospora coralii]
MNPIQVGLCGWGDHDLYERGTVSKQKLAVYAGHFPVVEVDSTYHAIAPAARIEAWCNETPDDFRFVVKAYRELTGHGRLEHAPERSWQQLVAETIASLEPMRKAGKLSAVLFQFPPWYDCNLKHVNYIRKIRQAFMDFTLAIEFRHQSWFMPQYQDRTIHFLQENQLIHVICDEPQAGLTSVPFIPVITHPEQVIVRFHGRNVAGWNNTGQPNWRDVRYAYRYSQAEIDALAHEMKQLVKATKQLTLLFNNNSQGDAQESARLMIDTLGIRFTGLAPKQLTFF